MWVLEARKDAEKVWYPVVWETTKESSDVVDYNINEEHTKDIAAEMNANNQTTTGMANVIPWVNAPKLIADTSIIWMWWWEAEATISNISVPINYNSSWQYQQLDSWITIINQWWAWFTEASWTVSVWKKWIYSVEVFIPFVFDTYWYNKTITIKNNWVNVLQETTALNENKTVKFTLWLNSWDAITMYCQVSTSSYAYLNGTMTLTFTKQ